MVILVITVCDMYFLKYFRLVYKYTIYIFKYLINYDRFINCLLILKSMSKVVDYKLVKKYCGTCLIIVFSDFHTYLPKYILLLIST